MSQQVSRWGSRVRVGQVSGPGFISMEVLPWEMGAAVRHIPNNLCRVFTAKFLNHEEPHVHPRGNPMSTVKCAFPEDAAFVCSDLHTSRSMYAHRPCMCVCVCSCSCVCFLCVRLCVSVCSFLVSGCEICGFSQSVLIFVSLSLSQQIIVKYTHTHTERKSEAEFTFNYSLTSPRPDI